ncbi:MAG: hypothetical protein ACRYFU_07545 [Janthinobacterium lividum]
MSNDFQLVALTTGQMTSFAQLEDGPFGERPPLRSFWCGELAEIWNLRGPVAKADFVSMATFKRPVHLLTLEAIELYRGIENNHLLSGGWGQRYRKPAISKSWFSETREQLRP